MPIVVTFDLVDADTNQRNRVQEIFEKFGWQGLGGTAYRYPPLAAPIAPEDWLNHVIPALMLFRRYLLSSNRVQLTGLTIDAHSSTGFDSQIPCGSAAHVLAATDLTTTPQNKFTVTKLLNWVNTNDYPYP